MEHIQIAAEAGSRRPHPGRALAGFLHDWAGGFILSSLLAAGALVAAATTAIGVRLPAAEAGLGAAT